MSRSLPFNPYQGVSSSRQAELDNYAGVLLERYGRDGSITFTEFGTMLYDISATSLSTTEKCNVWTTVARRKPEYNISNVGLIADNIDTFRPSTSHGHIVIGFDDGYHCPLANLTIDEAFNEIIRHEQNEGGIVGGIGRTVIGGITGSGSLNTGDATASLNQVRALKKFLEGGFAGYAQEWNRRFLGR